MNNEKNMKQKTLVIILLVIAFFLLVFFSQPKVKDAFSSIADTIEKKVVNGMPYYIQDYNKNPVGSHDRYSTEKVALSTIPSTLRNRHIKELKNLCDKTCQEQPECSAVDGKYSCTSGYESANKACTCLFQQTTSEAFTSGSLATTKNPITIAFENARYLPQWKMDSTFDSNWVSLRRKQLDLDTVNWSKDLDEYSICFWIKMDPTKMSRTVMPLMEIKQNNSRVLSVHMENYNGNISIEQKDPSGTPVHWTYFLNTKFNMRDYHLIITYKKNVVGVNNNGIEVFQNGQRVDNKYKDDSFWKPKIQNDANYHTNPSLSNNTLTLNRKDVSGFHLNKFIIYHNVLTDDEAQFMYLSTHKA